MSRDGQIHWTAGLSTELKIVDTQHQDLIDQVNVILERLVAKAPLSDCLDLLRGLAEETTNHFRLEERVMQNIGYPRLMEHKHQHDALLAEVSDFIGELEAGHGIDQIPQVLNFLKYWVLRHMSQEDVKIRDHILRMETELTAAPWPSDNPSDQRKAPSIR